MIGLSYEQAELFAEHTETVAKKMYGRGIGRAVCLVISNGATIEMLRDYCRLHSPEALEGFESAIKETFEAKGKA